MQPLKGTVPVGSMNIEIAKENLLLVRKAFKGIQFWLMYGTCLGAIRGGDFIKGDRDTDIGVFKKDIEAVEVVLKRLESEGFEIRRVIENLSVISIIRKNTYIDIYVMSKNDYGWNWNNVQEKDYLTKLGSIEFLGYNFSVPYPVSEFLEDKYGHDWKIPIKNKQANLVRK